LINISTGIGFLLNPPPPELFPLQSLAVLVLWLFALLLSPGDVIRGGLERRMADDIPRRRLNSFREGEGEGEGGGEEDAR
jgi:hypothetical protein